MTRTNKCRVVYWIFFSLHVLLMFGPILFYVPYGIATGNKLEKVAISSTSMVCIILLIVSLIVSVKARAALQKTTLWIFLLVLSTSLASATSFIVTMAILAIIDEVIVSNVLNYYRAALIANKEADKRERE